MSYISTAGGGGAGVSSFSGDGTFITNSGSTGAVTTTLGVLPPANGGVANITTADQGYLSTAQLLAGLTNVTAANNQIVTVGQQIFAFHLVIPIRIVVAHVTISVQAAGGAGSTVTTGLYSADGNTKILDSGTFNGNSATTQTLTITPVTITPGPYFYVQSASTQTTLTAAGYSANTTIAIGQLNNQTTKKWGSAANPAVAGVLPSALGAITANAAVLPIWSVFER